MGDSKEDRARPFSLVSSGRTRGNGHKLLYKKFHLNRKKKNYGWGGETVKQVTQRGYGVSTLQDIKNSTGHGPRAACCS